jgi:hypothetical protein
MIPSGPVIATMLAVSSARRRSRNSPVVRASRIDRASATQKTPNRQPVGDAEEPYLIPLPGHGRRTDSQQRGKDGEREACAHVLKEKREQQRHEIGSARCGRAA